MQHLYYYYYCKIHQYNNLQYSNAYTAAKKEAEENEKRKEGVLQNLKKEIASTTGRDTSITNYCFTIQTFV